MQAVNGGELEEISTESLGFLSIAGDSKVKLLPSPWPSDHLPPPTSSLLTIASARGLLAAAGPDALVIASTQSVREAFSNTEGGNVKAFNPQLTSPVRYRISHVVFSANEAALVISPENGGGLAVYDVAALETGNQTTFEIGTAGEALREVAPNPTKEKAELFALVTGKGQLLMANLNSRQLQNGPNGPVLKESVSCVSWSNKGKQLVAGLANGTAYQLTPEGEGKAEIPAPPGMAGGEPRHVSSISWLENDVFLIGYYAPSDMSGPAGVAFYIVTRQQSGFNFQKLPEVAIPFGLERNPPNQFISRLRNFPPNVLDLVIIAQTTSTEIGLFSRSRVPLAPESEPGKLTNVFTAIAMADDKYRAALPLSDSGDTSPVGVAMDLSARENVVNPIPGEEIEESKNPLPNYMVLDNEGVLSSWWVLYTDSVRQETVYPGLVVAGGIDQKLPSSDASLSGAMQMQTSTSTRQTSSFGQQPFAQPSSPSSGLAAPKWNSSTVPKTTPGFGVAGGGLGQKQSPWTSGGFGGSISGASSSPAFGQPAFGSPSALGGTGGGATFGASGGLGAKPSVWGSGTSSGTFGSGGMSSTAPMFSGSVSSGGFGSYAKSSEFSRLSSESAPSLFGKPASRPSSSAGMDTSFGSVKPDRPAFGASDGGFKLSSSFKGDGTAANDGPKPATLGSGGFGFGDLGNALGKTSVLPDGKEERMDDEIDEPAQPPEPPLPPPPPPPPDPAKESPTNQFAKVATPPPGFKPATFQKTSPLFRTRTQANDTPAAAHKSEPTPSFTFPESTTPEQSPAKAEEYTTPTPAPTSPKTREVPPSDDEATPAATPVQSHNQPDEPVPPNSTSKTEYSANDISATSSERSRPVDDAPLPPDLLKSNKSTEDEQPPLPDESDEGNESDEFEYSGEDVTRDVGSTDEPSQSLKFSPESSFGTTDRSPLGGSFTKVSQQNDLQRRGALFGEVGGRSAIPYFPPPSKGPESPRSPSPIRTGPPGLFRPESSRSVSAPTRPGMAIQNRIGQLGKSPLAVEPTVDEKRAAELEKQRAADHSARLQAEQDHFTDDEEEQIRRELQEDIEASLTLEPFVYHQDYENEATKPGIPGQIELLYRDVSSMINNLGINARSLESWMKWQMEKYAEADEIGINRLDIDDSDWCLDQVEELPIIADTISKDLEAGRLPDIRPKIRECHDLSQASSRLESRTKTIRKELDARKDPALLSAPLSAEQSSVQSDLRKASKNVQALLMDTEQNISVLKAQLSGFSSTYTSTPAPKRPTVEAVTTTIKKMTSMAEKRSVDIDLLESQLRKLDLVSNNDGSDPLLRATSTSPASSREASPFVNSSHTNGTRRSVRKSHQTPVSPGNTSVYYTPDATPTKTGGSGLKSSSSSMRSSLRASGTSNRFRASVDREDTPSRRLQRVSVSEEPLPGEKARFKEKIRKRKEALGAVRAALDSR